MMHALLFIMLWLLPNISFWCLALDGHCRVSGMRCAEITGCDCTSAAYHACQTVGLPVWVRAALLRGPLSLGSILSLGQKPPSPHWILPHSRMRAISTRGQYLLECHSVELCGWEADPAVARQPWQTYPASAPAEPPPLPSSCSRHLLRSCQACKIIF